MLRLFRRSFTIVSVWKDSLSICYCRDLAFYNKRAEAAFEGIFFAKSLYFKWRVSLWLMSIDIQQVF